MQHHSTESCSHGGQNNILYSKCQCHQQYSARRFSCNSVPKTKKKKTNNQIKQKQPKENMKNTTKQTKNQSSSTDENITALTLLKEK